MVPSDPNFFLLSETYTKILYIYPVCNKSEGILGKKESKSEGILGKLQSKYEGILGKK